MRQWSAKVSGRAIARLSLAALALAAACGGSSDSTGPINGGGGGDGFGLTAGNTLAASNAQPVQLAGGTTGMEMLLVVNDTSTGADGTTNFTISATGISAPGAVSAPSTSLIPAPAGLFAGFDASAATRLDISYGARVNERFRPRLNGMMSSARAARSLAPSAPSLAAQVGDVVSYNVNDSSCTIIDRHPARIVAVSAQAVIAVDTLNPPGGFSSADYQRFAANFDTLIYPVDVGNFGAPADIDGNGKVVLLFTRAVNALTPRNNPSFVGGFFLSRDLFPTVATARLDGCPGSNMAEMFYLLAPDPTGAVNGNVRTAAFVDSLTTGVIAHEFQHLINASRRIYVNNANELEVSWLNEGLSHIAEELLFFRQGQVGPRQNIGITALRASELTRNAFNNDQAANASRYRSYLQSPNDNSPIRDDDSLATRGATWDLLRYLADRKTAGGGTDASVWQALVNAKTTGIANLRQVFGANIGAQLRDWSVSHYTDDVVSNLSPDYSQPSWNWHSIYPVLSGNAPYPLKINQLTSTPASGTVIPGGAAFYRFSVPANATGSLTLTKSTGTTTGPLQGVVVRLR